MNTILLAHDYFGPDGPQINNKTHMDRDIISITYFKSLGSFEPFPSILIKENEYFIYEILLTFLEDEWIIQKHIDLLGTTSISNKTLDNIRYKNGYLLLNLATESITHSHFSVFDKIHNFCREENIKPAKVILQLGNIEALEIYKDYCLKNNINNEDKTELLNICPIEYFEFHTSFLMLHEVKPRKNINFNNIRKTFLCFNRFYRFHRINLTLLFYKLNLLKDSYFSMPEKCVWVPEVKFKDSILINDIYIKKYNISENDINEVQNLLPLTIDTSNFFDKIATHTIWGLSDYFDSSLISIVTETNFETGAIFNTEKIFRPIANRHPFIVAGPKGTIAHLKDLGYKTFSAYWDESYDDIEDPIERLDAIANLCTSINNWTTERKKLFFYESMRETNHNYKLLESISKENIAGRNKFWHYFKNQVRSEIK